MMRKLALTALALALLSGPAQAQAQDAAPDLGDPVKLFEGVCLADQVKLAHGSVAEQSYDALSVGAKDALGFANPAGAVPRIRPPFDLAAADVPNRIFAVLPKKRTFLLTPANGAGRYAASCVVLWEGNHYQEALKAAKTLAIDTPLQGGPSLGPSPAGLNYTVFTAKGMIVGAAEYHGWTVLRIAPDLSPSQEPASQ
jgi:hypothetical protein